jgi:hypothetical protein
VNGCAGATLVAFRINSSPGFGQRSSSREPRVAGFESADVDQLRAKFDRAIELPNVVQENAHLVLVRAEHHAGPRFGQFAANENGLQVEVARVLPERVDRGQPPRGGLRECASRHDEREDGGCGLHMIILPSAFRPSPR